MSDRTAQYNLAGLIYDKWRQRYPGWWDLAEEYASKLAHYHAGILKTSPTMSFLVCGAYNAPQKDAPNGRDPNPPHGAAVGQGRYLDDKEARKIIRAQIKEIWEEVQVARIVETVTPDA